MALVAFHQDQIDRMHMGQQLGQPWLGPHDLVQQRPARPGRHQDLMGAGLAVAVGVLAGAIHVEAVMRMLHGGDRQAAGAKQRDQSRQQGGLAAAGPADNAKDPHDQGSWRLGRPPVRGPEAWRRPAVR